MPESQDKPTVASEPALITPNPEPNPATEPVPSNAPAGDPGPVSTNPDGSVKMPPPSAMVEQFNGTGSAPAPESEPKPRRSPLVLILGLLAVLTLAGGAYAYFATNLFRSTTSATPTATPQPANFAAGLADSVNDVDKVLGEADTNLKDADTTLGDKMGDLAE